MMKGATIHEVEYRFICKLIKLLHAPNSWNGMTKYVPINGQIWLPFEHAQKYIPGCRWFK